MDKELDKIEFMLKGLSARYRIQPKAAVQVHYTPPFLTHFRSEIVSTGKHIKTTKLLHFYCKVSPQKLGKCFRFRILFSIFRLSIFTLRHKPIIAVYD